MKEAMGASKMLTGTPTRNIPLGRPRSSWEDNIRMNLKSMDINTRNWVDTAHDRHN